MTYRFPILCVNKSSKNFINYVPQNNITSFEKERKIAQCYRELNLPNNSKQDQVRQSFIELAKRYHPDSGSPEANVDKFCVIENAFRVLSKHNTGSHNNVEVENIIIDIKHTAPQHRQYLSFEGVGYGTPFQRQKQWTQARAQKATENVMEHRVAKALASENAILKKGEITKKHDVKTKYGFDRVVEDLIQESISKGEFDNLTGKGKPLRDQSINPYVDYSTHKLNEVLINNGFTPEWIIMNKEIEKDIEVFKEDLRLERMNLGPLPLTDANQQKWLTICQNYKERAKSINTEINNFNIIVPLMNKQKFHIEFENICKDILENGKFQVGGREEVKATVQDNSEDLLSLFFNMFSYIFGGFTKGVNRKEKGYR